MNCDPGDSLESVPSLETPWRVFRPWRLPGEDSVAGDSLERIPSLETPWRVFCPCVLRDNWRLFGDVSVFSFFKSKI